MRKKKQLVAVFLALAVLLAACGGGDGVSLQGVNQGNQALDFTLENLAGEQVSLSDYEGKVVLINFWATWCPPCRAEIPDLEAAYLEHSDEGFVVLGVSVQDPSQAIVDFMDQVDMSYPILLDENGLIMKDYRAPGLPMSLIVDRQGVIQVRHLGFLSAGQLADYLSTVLE